VGDQARTMSRICIGYVQKPVRPRELVNLASAVLKLPALPKSPKQPRPPARPPGR